jgi:hypothetical protein
MHGDCFWLPWCRFVAQQLPAGASCTAAHLTGWQQRHAGSYGRPSRAGFPSYRAGPLLTGRPRCGGSSGSPESRGIRGACRGRLCRRHPSALPRAILHCECAPGRPSRNSPFQSKPRMSACSRMKRLFHAHDAHKGCVVCLLPRQDRTARVRDINGATWQLMEVRSGKVGPHAQQQPGGDRSCLFASVGSMPVRRTPRAEGCPSGAGAASQGGPKTSANMVAPACCVRCCRCWSGCAA